MHRGVPWDELVHQGRHTGDSPSGTVLVAVVMLLEGTMLRKKVLSPVSWRTGGLHLSLSVC